MLVEDHTPRWRSRAFWFSVRSYTRKEIGVLVAVGLFRGAHTAIFCAFVISMTAPKISVLMVVWVGELKTSVRKGWGSSLWPGRFSQSLISLRSMLPRGAVWCVRWTLGIVAAATCWRVLLWLRGMCAL